MARVSDEQGHVIGVDLSGSKIGGSVEGSILLLPDPMGATGSTTIRAVKHYHERHGKPSRIIAMPMMATPEYLRAVAGEGTGVRRRFGAVDRGARGVRLAGAVADPSGSGLRPADAAGGLRARRGGLELAADNGEELSVVTGPEDAVATLETTLAERGVFRRRLSIRHSPHGSTMAPEELVGAMAKL